MENLISSVPEIDQDGLVGYWNFSQELDSFVPDNDVLTELVMVMMDKYLVLLGVINYLHN